MIIPTYSGMALTDALENPKAHTHSHWVKRSWWKWRFSYDREGLGWFHKEFPRILLVKFDLVEVPCPSKLHSVGPIKMERERTDMATRIVASRRFACENPIVGNTNDVILYAATLTYD